MSAFLKENLSVLKGFVASPQETFKASPLYRFHSENPHEIGRNGGKIW